MILAEVGTNSAVEAYRDPLSDDPEKIRYRALSGERIVHLEISDDDVYTDAVHDCVESIRLHLQRDTNPLWIECTNGRIQEALLANYGLSLSAARRPVDWGKP